MRFVLFFLFGAFGFGFLGALEDVFSGFVLLRTGLGEMSNLRTGFLVREDLRQPTSDSGSVSFIDDVVDAEVGVPLRGVTHTSYT